MIKRFLFWSVLTSAVGIPYVVSSSSEWIRSAKTRLTSAVSSAESKDNFAGTHTSVWDQGTTAAHAVGQAKPMPVEGYGRYDLAEVLHFDGTPAWVMSRWPRVTSGLAEPGLQGYRVPLITGTGEDDLAGSLTYYFDTEQKVRLVHFRGTTGNPHKLVAFVTARFGLEPQLTSDPGLHLYQLKWNGKPLSELRIRTADILRASEAYTRYQVELAMKRP